MAPKEPTLHALTYFRDQDFSYGDAFKIPGYESPKYTFLKGAGAYLKKVAKHLGYKGKPQKNPGGGAVGGDVTMVIPLEDGDGSLLYLHIGHLLAPTFMWRVGKKPYAVDGNNTWIDEDLTRAQVAARIEKALL